MYIKKFNHLLESDHRSQWVFFILLLAFVMSKLTHLDISFFWDESWVYAPAIKSMASNGPSLLPDAIPLEYSRGHPLFFHFLGGVWIKLFGETNLSLHAFALSITVTFLVFLKKLISRFLSPPHVFIFLLLLIVQPVFYAQSSMVLPEMLLGMLSAAALYFYLEKRYGLYIILGSLAMLTKETAIVLICSATLHGFLIHIKKRDSLLTILKHILIGLIPLFTLILHMVYLKYVFGWYLYPEHTGMMNMNFSSIMHRSLYIVNDLIFIQKRFIVTIPFVLLYIYGLLKKKRMIDNIIVAVYLTISIILFSFFDKNYVFPSLFLMILAHFTISSIVKNDEKNYPFLLFGIFIFTFIVFSAINFYTVRYLLSILPFVLLIPVYYLINHAWKQKLILYFLMASSLVFIYELLTPNRINDINLTYLHYCPLQSEIVKYMEDENLYGEEINTKFLMSVALKDTNAGYRNTSNNFNYINTSKESGNDYYIFYNTEPDPFKETMANNPGASLLKRVESRHIWFEVWEVIP